MTTSPQTRTESTRRRAGQVGRWVLEKTPWYALLGLLFVLFFWGALSTLWITLSPGVVKFIRAAAAASYEDQVTACALVGVLGLTFLFLVLVLILMRPRVARFVTPGPSEATSVAGLVTTERILSDESRLR